MGRTSKKGGEGSGNICIPKGNNLLEHNREPSGSMFIPKLTLWYLSMQDYKSVPTEGPV